MPRSLRHALVAILIALHAAVSVCGEGLHALPGWGHLSGLQAFAKTDHSHGAGKSSHQAADECPVCQFLAQGQLSLGTTSGCVSRLIVELVTPDAPAADLILPHSSSAPRAPPRARSAA